MQSGRQHALLISLEWKKRPLVSNEHYAAVFQVAGGTGYSDGVATMLPRTTACPERWQACWLVGFGDSMKPACCDVQSQMSMGASGTMFATLAPSAALADLTDLRFLFSIRLRQSPVWLFFVFTVGQGGIDLRC